MLALLLAASPWAAPQPPAAPGPPSAAALAAEIRQGSLDPEACYRVRDLTIEREDARIYLTDGYLIFGRPVAGRRIFAAFQTAEAGDDAEVLLRPPDRSERMSLAKATGSPNLDEHFRAMILLFTDGTARELDDQIRQGSVKPSPDMGRLLADRLNLSARNLIASFQVRLVLDLLTNQPEQGVFYSAIMGQRLGNFDLLFDPLSQEQIVIGQVASGRGAAGFDIWSSFAGRAARQGRPGIPDAAVLDNYRIEASVGSDMGLSVRTRATVNARRRISGALAFEITPQMEVSEALLDGKPAEIFRRESFRANLIGGRRNEPFLVVLPAPLEAGSSHEIEFRHSGNVIVPAGNKVFFVAARTNWYPTHGFHFATFDLQFKVPKDLNVVASGDPVEDRVEGEWRIARRKVPAPVRLAGFNIGSYESVTLNRDGVDVEVCANRLAEAGLAARAPQSYIINQTLRANSNLPIRRADIIALPSPPPDTRARLTEIASEVASSFEWMASQFGPPPLRRLTVSPIPGSFGQGFPGLLYLSTLAFIKEQERPAGVQASGQNVFYSEILHAHETAHQWWGNLVTSASYRDDWILEAAANYSALMVLERKKGTKAMEMVLEEYRNELRKAMSDGKPVESAGPLTWGVRLQTEATPDPWRTIIYCKGSWVMHMLRRRMGDAAFMKMLGALVKQYSYDDLSTAQLREAAASFLPKGSPDPKLEGFFDNWVYSTGIPVLDISTSVRGKAPAVTVSVTVKQSGVPEEFGVDLPVEVRIPGQARPLVKWLRTSDEPAILTWKLNAPPSKVEVAPGMAVLTARK